MLPRFPVPAVNTPAPFSAGQINDANNDTSNDPNPGRGAFSIQLKSTGPATAASSFDASSPFTHSGMPRFGLLPTDMQAKREIQRNADFKVFSALICSTNGIDALHDVLSGYSAKIDFQDIAAKLDRMDLASLKTEIERIGSKRGLNDIAASVHVSPGTSRPPAVTAYARLRLSAEAITYLWSCHESGMFVKAGRFIPCGKEREIRNAAAEGSVDDRYTGFLTLQGYSLKSLDRQVSAVSAYNAVFSPRAVFEIEDIAVNDAEKAFQLTLTETAKPKNAIDLPF